MSLSAGRLVTIPLAAQSVIITADHVLNTKEPILADTARDPGNNSAAVAPGSGRLETGVWSTRGLRTFPRGLEGLNLVGADIVDVAQAYES